MPGGISWWRTRKSVKDSSDASSLQLSGQYAFIAAEAEGVLDLVLKSLDGIVASSSCNSGLCALQRLTQISRSYVRPFVSATMISRSTQRLCPRVIHSKSDA